MDGSTPVTRPATQPTRSLVLILGALAAFGPLAVDMYLPAFPVIGAALAADPAAVQRTLATFFAGMGLGQLLHGPLADRYGRRGPLLAAIAVFALASAGCAAAPSAEWLAALRFLQGLGGCAGMVIARAVVRDVAEGPAAIRLMSRLMLVMSLAPILAPSIGSVVLAVAGWRVIFGVLAAYAALLLLVVARAMPETLPPPRRRRDSPTGVVLLYARLLADRRFLGPALAAAWPMAGMFTYIAGSPFVFMQVFDLSAELYGVLFGVNAVGITLVSQLNARAATRIPAARVLVWVQAAMATAGLALLAATAAGIAGVVATAVLLLLFVSGIGAVVPLAVTRAMASQGGQAGSASAALGALQFGLGAVLGAVLAAAADGSALPMAAVIAFCGVAGPLSLRLLNHTGPRRS